MAKKISLNIPVERYEKLTALSDFYRQDIKDTISEILDLVTAESEHIMHLTKEYKVPAKLSMIMSHVFFAGFDSMRALFNKILENLDVKGLYALGDLDVDLDERYMMFSYDALVGCALRIDGFYVTLESGLATLTTNSYIEVEKTSNRAITKLRNLIKSIEEPEEFYELEDYDIRVEEEGELCTLQIDCTAESLNYLPSVKKISKLVERIFKKAGI